MAIGFARLQFVQRSQGKNACAKSAYIGREKIRFEGTKFAEAKTYDWSRRERVSHNEIMLPPHVNEAFLNPEFLWNSAEAKENRLNSQTALELVFALPDDLEVSLQDKIDLLRGYVKDNFVDKGLAAQVVIHPPERKLQLNEENGDLEEFNHNWHAHVLLTTRLFKEFGDGLEDLKARHLMPTIKTLPNGKIKVVFANDNGRSWGDYQNLFFESKGMSLRVDPNGVVSQIHMGPVRLRGRALSILENNDLQKDLNAEEIKNPAKLVEAITKQKNIFTREDLGRVIHKFIGPNQSNELVKAAISQSNVVQLFDPKTGKLPINPSTGIPEEKYTTIEVLAEEKKCLLLADIIHKKPAFNIGLKQSIEQFSSKLTPEQKSAFQNILSGRRLSCVEGHAGTGKSFLLFALKEAYESEGYVVRAFGPDSATSQVLKDKGFSSADNVYNFLFRVNRSEKNRGVQNKQAYSRARQLSLGHPVSSKSNTSKTPHIREDLKIGKGKEIWLIDESTKLGNRPMLQILKYAEKYNAQVVFAGGASQLLPVERGCLYDVLSRRYGSEKLEDIQRQKDSFQREISKKIANGEMADALNRLISSNSIIWVDSRERSNPLTQNFVENVFGCQGDKLKLNDRQMAIEELVKQWAADRNAFPSASSIIIACSNQEVRTINEMVRSYRKEVGEISKKEFRYETEFGDILVSQGDIIEFGSKNSDLGVTNGTKGTLVKISPNQLTILVKNQEGKGREINVDPNKYASFKLGYATTYFRSQGNTIDRAYVLHSVHTNREMFYVGLTRHVRKVHMYVPKSNFHYLSYLKAQAGGFEGRFGKYLALNDYFIGKETVEYLNDFIDQVSQSTAKFSTTDFVSSHQLRQAEKENQINELKQSVSMLDRFKGYSLSAWNRVSMTVENYRENKQQEIREAQFFTPVIKKLEEKVRIQEEAIYEPSAQDYRQSFINSLVQSKEKSPLNKPVVWEGLSVEHQKMMSEYLDKASRAWYMHRKIEGGVEANSPLLCAWEKGCFERNVLANQLVKALPKDVICEILGNDYLKSLQIQSNQIEKPICKGGEDRSGVASNLKSYESLLKVENNRANDSIKALSLEQKKALNSYQQLSKESSSLHALVQVENENDNKKSSHHMAWQVTCGKRNRAAYQLLSTTPQESLFKIMGQKSFDFLSDQSKRHESLINRTKAESIDVVAKLRDNLEPLLFRLFPEGPTRKSRGEWRFGSKGSLVVTCHGEKMGCFYSHSEGKGGGPLQLIEMTLGFDAKQSREWAMDFIGAAKDIVVPSQFKMKRAPLEAESKWIAIKPNPKDPAPPLKEMPNCKFARYLKEEARYSYQNEKGELLFYTSRLINNKGEKSVLPLSYGIEADRNQQPHWDFKAYQSTERTLYNLQLLQQNPKAKVVIVEGEKTADAANRLLSQHNMICLTWLGGAKATSRTDWSPLVARDVIIWPDNDKPGFEAAKDICSELRKVGVNSLRVVDEKTLIKVFPAKWDLADPLPEGKKEGFVRDLLLLSNEKAVSLSNFAFAVDKSNKDVELLRVREVLWRVEDRLRQNLEDNMKDKPLEISQQIIKETLGIYQQKNALTQKIKNELGVDAYHAERLAFQALIYKAEYGKELPQEKIVGMKEVLQNSTSLLPKYSLAGGYKSEEFYDLVVDKTLSSVINNKHGKFSNDLTVTFEKEAVKIQQYIQIQHHLQQRTPHKNMSKGVDLTI